MRYFVVVCRRRYQIEWEGLLLVVKVIDLAWPHNHIHTEICQIMITFLSYISNACHSLSGVAERLQHTHRNLTYHLYIILAMPVTLCQAGVARGSNIHSEMLLVLRDGSAAPTYTPKAPRTRLQHKHRELSQFSRKWALLKWLSTSRYMGLCNTCNTHTYSPT